MKSLRGEGIWVVCLGWRRDRTICKMNGMPVPLEQPRVKTRLNKYAASGSPSSLPLFYFFPSHKTKPNVRATESGQAEGK